MSNEHTVADVGEKWIIEHVIVPICGQPRRGIGVGDDAAVLPVPEGSEVVVSTDKIPEDLLALEFGLMEPYEHGRYLAEVNISDMAAMGATPIALLLSLTLPNDFPLERLRGFVRGFAERARYWDATVVGGDTKWGSAPSLAATALGTVPEGRALTRHGARPGDRLFVTGPVGGFGAALLYWGSGGGHSWRVEEKHERWLRERLTAPSARVRLGRSLGASGLVSACMDVTDGLGGSLNELATANTAAAVIDVSALPIHDATRAVCQELGVALTDVVLGIGLDLELVGALRAGADVRNDLIVIGEFAAGTGVHLRDERGVRRAKFKGWEHFAADARRQLARRGARHNRA